MFATKVVEETLPQLLQKVPILWCKQMFVYIDEDFAIFTFSKQALYESLDFCESSAYTD